MAAPSVTQLPDPPSPFSTPSQFSADAFIFVAALAGWTGDINNLVDWLNANIDAREVVNETGTAFNLNAQNSGAYIRTTNGGAKTLTVQPESVTAQPEGASYFIANRGAGDLTIVAGSGVVINGNVALTENATAILQKIGTDTYDLIAIGGDFVTDLTVLQADVATLQSQMTTRIQSVATIADLRNFEGAADGDQVSLLGGTTPGIDGGCFYRVTNGSLSDDGRDVIRYAATDIYWVRQDLAKYQLEDAATHNGLTFDQRDDTQLATILRRNYKYQIAMPIEFQPPFYTIPVNIYFKGGRYFTDFDPRALRPVRTNTYYVAPNSFESSDSNDGLTWDTAFATVSHALSLPGDNEIVVSPGKYYYPQGFVAVNKSTGFNLVCPDGIAEFTQEAYPRVWVEDLTYPGTYTTPSVIQGEDWGAVSSDLRFYLVGSSGSSATTAGGTRIPPASRSAVQLGAVGVAVEADTTYIRLPGNRPPIGSDFIVKYAAAGLNVNFNGAATTHHVFMENISIGYGAPYAARFANDRDDCRVVCVNCEFLGGHSGNTVEWDCLGWVINVGCVANGAFKDGFNYHISPGAGSFLNVLEIDCRANYNGKDLSGNNNGSTVHESLRVIRLNGDYSYNQNRNIHDIESSRSFNVGLKLRGGQSYDSPSFMVGRDAQPDSTRGWLVGCDVDIIRVANSATLYISDDTTYRDLQVESGGTVIDYNP